MSAQKDPYRGPGVAGRRTRAWLTWVVMSILVLVACLTLIEPFANLPHRVPRQTNEGWNAYWAATAMSGGPLYPALDATISNNYPPASFFVVGWLGQLIHDPIIAGRALALAALLAVAATIALWLRWNGVRWSVVILTTAAFVITVDVLAPDYTAANDPQWFAHALALLGLTVIWRKPDSTSRLAASAALMIGAGWVKHLVVPLPLTVVIWLATSRPRAFWKWISFAAAFAACVLALSMYLWGSSFLTDVLSSPRVLSVRRSALMACVYIPAVLPLLFVAGISLREYRATEPERFATWYLLIAGICALLACIGEGVAANAYFDVAIAASLAAGLALERVLLKQSLGQSLDNLEKVALFAPAIIYIAVVIPHVLSATGARFHRLSAQIRETPDDIALIRRAGIQAAACESLSLCFWAGAPFKLDFFNFGQKLLTHRVPLDVCRDLFDGTRFSVIEMSSPPWNARENYQLPSACYRAIALHYEVVRHSINGVYLVPRPKVRG